MCVFIFRRGDHRSPVGYFSIAHPSVGIADSSPQWEPYKMPLLEERWHAVTEWWLKKDVDVPSLFPHTNSLKATNGRPYETLAVLQYKTTQKGDQRPPYEIFII